MPKVKYCVPQNGIRDLFKAYMQAQGINSADLGELLNKSDSAVRHKMKSGNWSNAELKTWCKALNISDKEQIGDAILR